MPDKEIPKIHIGDLPPTDGTIWWYNPKTGYIKTFIKDWVEVGSPVASEEALKQIFEANVKFEPNEKLFQPFQREGDGYFHSEINKLFQSFKCGFEFGFGVASNASGYKELAIANLEKMIEQRHPDSEALEKIMEFIKTLP